MYKYQAVTVQGSLEEAFQETLDEWSTKGWRLASVVPGQEDAWPILIFEKESRDYQDFAMTPEQYRKMYLNDWTPTEPE